MLPSHPEYRKAAENRADDRIDQVEKLLGCVSNPVCRHCEAIVTIFGHQMDCSLRAINPDNLRDEILMGHQELKKTVNRQRIFRSDKKHWNGLPGKKKGTLVRKEFPRIAAQRGNYKDV